MRTRDLARDLAQLRKENAILADGLAEAIDRIFALEIRLTPKATKRFLDREQPGHHKGRPVRILAENIQSTHVIYRATGETAWVPTSEVIREKRTA